jgi:hypothetical protein
MKVYWLIELRTKPASSPLYHTSPGIWGSSPDLATKYYTKAGAEAEAEFIRWPGSPHEIVVVDHAWCDATPKDAE